MGNMSITEQGEKLNIKTEVMFKELEGLTYNQCQYIIDQLQLWIRGAVIIPSKS